MDRRQLLAALGGAATLYGLGAGTKAFGSSRKKPNFIVICCDDLGYGDVGAFGGRAISTPNIDRLAARGRRLSDYYAPANLCTPSRAGFLTGRYPIRTGLASGVIMQNDERGLPLSEVTIAEALKPDYTAALVGKWHLGHSGAAWPPMKHGFDLFYGIPYSHDMLPLSLYEGRGDALRELPFEYRELQQMFYARSARFIEENRNRPFFLNLALSAPHLPNYPPPAFAGRSAAGAYGDAVEEIDQIVGRLVEKLEQLGLAEDTLIVFTSDNGPWFEGSAGGFRQRKGGGGYDGGYRVPCIACQPGTIPAGSSSASIAMGIDFLPTFCGMAGLPLPSGAELDGRDISGVLLDGGPSPHDELLMFDNEDVVGIRTARWKYIVADYYRGFEMSVEGRGYPQLYDMSTGGNEDYSVASLHPDIVRQMEMRMAAARSRFEPLRKARSNIILTPGNRPPAHVPEIWRD